MPFRRWQSVLFGLWSLGLVVGGGCASNPLAGRFGGGEREPVVSHHSDDDTQETKSADRKPAKSQDHSAEKERRGAVAQTPQKSDRSLDPATRMLIDTELKDLPAADRQRWKSYLATVSPDEIPQILQKRAEGVIPPEVADSRQVAEVESSSKSLSGKKANPFPRGLREAPASVISDTKSEDETASDAPDREVLQTSNEVEVTDPADGSSPASKTSQVSNAVSLERPVEEEIANDSATNSPVIQPQTEPKDRHAPDQLAMNTPEEQKADKRATDQMRIWPHGKRPERTFTDRISGGHLPPLTPPWSRDAKPATDEKSPKPRARGKVATNEPAPAIPREATVHTDPKADYWQDELRKLISLMEAEASRPPADDSPAEHQAHIQRQVYLRMLYLMAAEPEKAQLPIADVDAVDQEFWTSMFWGMSNYFDDEQTGDPGVRAAQTIAQLHAAARQLQSVADLELRNVGFCQKIDGWGLYERFDRDEFEPGQEVLLYGELRNFDTEATAAGLYRTLVGSTIEIVRTGQEDSVLDRHDLGDTEDLCRGLRTDFYNSYRMTLPAHLTSGSYQLRLTVEDKLSGRFATQTIGFTIR